MIGLFNFNGFSGAAKRLSAVCAAFANRKDAPYIVGGRYGLSSKDTTPEQIKAVFDHLLDKDFKTLFARADEAMYACKAEYYRTHGDRRRR